MTKPSILAKHARRIAATRLCRPELLATQLPPLPKKAPF